MKANSIKISCFTAALICITCLGLKAQDLFIKQARITYEKKRSVGKELAETPLGASFVKGAVTSWMVLFDEGHSLYRSVPIDDDAALIRESMNQNLKDELYFDYQKRSSFRKKIVNKEAFLLEDTIPSLKWKVLPELRQIAGYECRKALTIINDSVYVVAFYTDNLLLKGGPEGFNGLPGMILGIAIPRLQTTWFATKVDVSPVDAKELQLPAGKKTTPGELSSLLDKISAKNSYGTQKPVAIKAKKMSFDFLL